jgi:perosamine synthetase
LFDFSSIGFMKKSNFHKVVVSPEDPVHEAMRRIDAGGMGLVLVVGADGRLQGTVTDGDLRRGMLRGVGGDALVRLVMNPTPVTARADASEEEVLHLIQSRSLRHVPIVDGAMHLVGLEVSADLSGQVSLAVPWFAGNEMKYLQEAIETTWVSSAGPFVARFEEAVADWIGARHAVATVNGTAALHISLLVAGVQPDEEVLVPALSFVATANAVSYCGAHPVFMDVDRESWNLDPEKLRNYLEEEATVQNGQTVNQRTGRRIRAVLPVQLLGHPADMDPILEVARRFGLAVIEDACQALGALYKGRPAGCLGDVACFSFNGNKVVTAGGGGMLVSNEEGLAMRARHLTTQARDSEEECSHDAIGFNYRLTNVCAAIGLAQMERLKEFLQRKRQIAERYREALRDTPGLSCMPTADWATASVWLFTVLVETGGEGAAAHLVTHLRERGIESRRLWQPLHTLPMYAREMAYRVTVAPDLFARGVALPSSVHLQETEQDRVIDCLLEWVRGVSP